MAEGRCTCGAVRYRLQDKPFAVHCCHCRDCQRETGSAFVINGLIETPHVEVIEGEPETILTSRYEKYAGFAINSQGVFLASNYGNLAGGSLRFAPTGVGTPYAEDWLVHPTSLDVTESYVYLSLWQDNGLNEGVVYQIGLCVDSVCQ